MQSKVHRLRPAQLNPTYIYSMPHLQTNRCFHDNQLYFWSLPQHLPSPHTTSMTMQFQLWREERHRQGGAELDAAVARSGGVPWCLALFHSTIPKNANHTETCLRPPLPFSKPSTYWDLALPFDEHALVLRCRSCLCCYVCTGCHQSTQLIFGVRFCFCMCVDFQPK